MALVNGLCGAGDVVVARSLLVHRLIETPPPALALGGISRHPPQDKLEEFLPICGNLDIERVGHLIQEHLVSLKEKVGVQSKSISCL
jgi:hypothetical protein